MFIIRRRKKEDITNGETESEADSFSLFGTGITNTMEMNDDSLNSAVGDVFPNNVDQYEDDKKFLCH